MRPYACCVLGAIVARAAALAALAQLEDVVDAVVQCPFQKKIFVWGA